MTVTIREDVKGGILLTGLHQVEIKSLDDLLRALNFGSSIRQTDATAINAKSSRSHAVFSISLVQRKNNSQSTTAQEKIFSVPVESLNGSDHWVTIDSKLHFVDLAGSERLKNTGASGERAKEGISINAGLASLGKVISQLSSRHSGSHVSYRDSKLTRLLQDSLGGNAITYMIACVTPAEFHLSETLNTVQYAQRARAIQSKPRIQQFSDEQDKQAVIDRLRVEVSFLRDQIRKSQNDDRRGSMPQERAERQNEREIELQNRLLDLQENYTALSQRHAKLISEITQARGEEPSDTPTLREAIGHSAVERLSRSNSFAEAVEQVVLEYEKTIQSLESSLSRTRASLSETESSLLGKETNCAYIETVNQQLQNRVQKMMDRESSTEKYLQDLESKLDGHSFGEEKNTMVVTELRKEIARIRESEASCEEYISTLEERLAEADQGLELMRREVDRLENVVERQRSLGKLDNLLYDFDHLPDPYNSLDEGQSSISDIRNRSFVLSLQDAMNTPIPDSDDEDRYHPSKGTQDLPKSPHDSGQRNKIVVSHPTSLGSSVSPRPETPGESYETPNCGAGRLESVTQELFDLRAEHETSVHEYDAMSAKYEQALKTLAELQDAVGKERYPAAVTPSGTPTSSRPTSSLRDTREEESKDDKHLSSLHSLPFEISSAGSSAGQLIHAPAHKEALASKIVSDPNNEVLLQEIMDLKTTQAEKDLSLRSFTEKYSQLQDLYLETLDIVEELRAEIHKSKAKGPNSPKAPLIRRKGSQAIMTIDRAHRSLASLRNIASENLADKPDIMQSFEMNLNSTMHELHQRSERVQVLEAELSSVKKEMEGKMTMISGLARERSSLKSSSPMDISVVSSMHDQLLEAETQMKAMCKSHAVREHELVIEVESLKSRLASQTDDTTVATPGLFLEPSDVREGDRHDLEFLEPSMQLQKARGLRKTDINQRKKALSNQPSVQKPNPSHPAIIADELHHKRADNDRALSDPKDRLGKHKTLISVQIKRIAELELFNTAAREVVEEGTLYKMNLRAHLDSNQDRIYFLERHLEAHRSSIESYRDGLKSLRESHAQALEELRSTTLSEAKVRMENHLRTWAGDNEKKHHEREAALLDSIKFANKQLGGLVDSKDDLESSNGSRNEETILLSALVSKVTEMIHHLEEEKAIVDLRFSDLESQVLDINNSHQQSLTELQKAKDEKEKARRLVDELEDQLSTTYEQHQATSSRLSMLKSNRDQALQDANLTKKKMEEEIEIHRTRVAQLEVNSYSLRSLHQR